MQADIKPIKLVTIIVDRAKGRKVSAVLNDSEFEHHCGFLGRGTAPSEISAVLGLGEREKALILLLTPGDRVEKLFAILSEELEIGRGGGIAFTTPINSVSNMEVVKFILGLN